MNQENEEEAPRTQKGRGIRALRIQRLGQSLKYYTLSRFPTLEIYREVRRRIGIPLFARPCPVTPRHGFVDSRRISSYPELLSLWIETRKADSQAEVILMREIKANASSVLTPTSITIGEGTDGATSGKPGSLHFPLAGMYFESNLLKEAEVNNFPYLESLHIENRPEHRTCKYDFSGDFTQTLLVQLRDGTEPPGNGTGNSIITKALTVERILFAEGDLIEWERTLGEIQNKKGLLIWHPNGSPLSHYSQHAILNGLPIAFSKVAPAVGKKLKPNTKRIKPNIAAFEEGFISGFDQKFAPSHVRAALLLIHNASVLLPSHETARLVGVGAAMILRAATSAVIGELRYIRRRSGGRDGVYGKVLGGGGDSFWKSRTRLRRARELFRVTHHWPGDSFGGPKWADCADLTFSLYKAGGEFLKNRTKKNMLEVIQGCHRVINSTHNGGPLLSKFAVNSEFSGVAEGDIYTVAQAGYCVWKLRNGSVLARDDLYRRWVRERLPPEAGPNADALRIQVRGIGSQKIKIQVGKPGNYASACVTSSYVQKYGGPRRYSLNSPSRTVYEEVSINELPSEIRKELVKRNLISLSGEINVR